MNFTSPLFLIGFPVILLLYRHISTPIWRQRLLLAASWLFYLGGSVRSFPLLIAITLVTWYGAIAVSSFDDSESVTKQRIILTAVSAFAIGLLIIFKYTTATVWLMPPGISFYSFQSLAYVFDVKRKKIEPERRFFSYALFVSFFPQLVAGPIERAGDLLPQLTGGNKADYEDSCKGILLLLCGFFKKVVIADFLSPYVALLFDAPSHTGSDVLLGAVLFAFQIYADFSGYSDIARGAAALLGVKLSINFDAPYLASNIREFWRRWHITLTRWFTDYVYIPLGGSRKGTLVTLRNILIVFALSGLWHGASMHFVLWGLFHGILLCAYLLFRMLKKDSKSTANTSPAAHCIFVALTFLVTSVGWIFFRASGVREAFMMIAALPFGWSEAPFRLYSLLTPTIFEVIRLVTVPMVLYGIRLLSAKLSKATPNDWRFQAVVFAAVHIILLSAIYNLSLGSENAFIYFQF